MNELLEKRRRVIGDSPHFYSKPIVMEKSEGVWLYDVEGQKYLDVYNNVPVVGHCHPRVVEALTRQVSKLNVHSRYLNALVVEYAEKLTSLHTDKLCKLQMACSGTEAAEVALRMARIFTDGQGIICSNATYHGNSHEIFRMTAGPFEPEFRRVHYPQFYRPLVEGLSSEDLCELYLEEVRKQIQAFQKDGIKFAGLIFCSIFANEGLPNFPKTYFSKVSKIVRESGGVLILDEVQSGFGRTGNWWGYELCDVSPDIVIMGKPMGAGVPVSGVVANAEIVDRFHQKIRYFNTTAGTPLQAVVGMAVIDIINQEGLVENASNIGHYLKKQLNQIKNDFNFIGDVRGPGLFLGLDIVGNKGNKNADKDKAERIVELMRDRGVLISNSGQHKNVLKVRPPLIFEKKHADLFLGALVDSCQKVN